jgi:hypothetical protein
MAALARVCVCGCGREIPASARSHKLTFDMSCRKRLSRRQHPCRNNSPCDEQIRHEMRRWWRDRYTLDEIHVIASWLNLDEMPSEEQVAA